jgi:lysophospholipase L1-like esterase
MKTFTKLVIILSVTLFITGCQDKAPQKYSADNNLLTYSGRIDKISASEVKLIGSASFVSMQFTGDTCVVYLKNNTPNGLQNYVSLELDGEDLGRTRLEGDSMVALPVDIAFPNDQHKLTIYKSTEAANGNVIFAGVLCQQLVEQPVQTEKSIEFIGNSITCGMGNDTIDIPCHTDQWYDQHNAYWAYGPIVARALKLNYMLSSVSGIGIYRNWNVEDGPTMPMVYENRYLNTDASKQWDFSYFTPDIVSIALGTNDFSDGDGIHERHPFDATVFSTNYIKFVETIYSHYPATQIALLTSPMITGEKDSLFIQCLTTVKNHFKGSNHKPIAIFQFEGIAPHGCDYHPDIEDHMQMADQLIPFYQELLGEVED